MKTKAARTTAIGLLIGGVVGMFSAQDPSLLVLAVIASFGLTLGRRPALLLGVFLMVDQTYVGTPYFQDIGPLVTTGHQFYEPVKNLPPSLLMLTIAFIVQLYTGRGIAARKLRTHGLDGVGIVLVALLVWTALLSLSQEKTDFSAGSMLRISTNTLAAVLPWLLMLLTYAITVGLLRQPGGRSEFTRVVAIALVAKGVLGLVVLLTTHGAVIDGQHNVVYYDAALPMVAGMAMLGFLLASPYPVPRRKLILFLAGTIVVFSFRRSVWVAMAVAVLLLPLVRARTVVIQRVLVGSALSLLVLLLMPATIKDAAFSRVGSAISVAQGTGSEDSAKNHKKDVERGYQIAKDHIWLGVGVRAAQQREFAYQEINRLYVHNDPLQVWLHLGLPGGVLYLMLMAILCWRGLMTLRRGDGLSVLDAGSATFAAACFVAVMLAPFISETTRWPVFVGAVAAVLRTSETAAREAAVRRRAAAAARRGLLAPAAPVRVAASVSAR
ncbi:MAG: O-antigen ligase family protein [Actinomycetota bacterium]